MLDIRCVDDGKSAGDRILSAGHTFCSVAFSRVVKSKVLTANINMLALLLIKSTTFTKCRTSTIADLQALVQTRMQAMMQALWLNDVLILGVRVLFSALYL